MVCRKLLVRGKGVSAIAFMSTNGLLDCKTFTGSVNLCRLLSYLT